MLDFSLEKSENFENIGKVSLFVHKSGGRVICIDNEDENRVFALSFDTPANDDTGIAHILEHCVLCGSKKFPAKDPFNLLDINVPHTYLNAITFPHKTLFPVASLDEKALMLMAEVYCDGVFDPLVYQNKGIFMQEGGFYDGKGINGVVYGEMSGFYDDPENLAERYLKAVFTPHFSAGLPEDIPNADYKKMLEYHKKHYTGTNCLAFVYGKDDKKPYLELLSRYFGCGEKIIQRPILKKEVRHIPLPNDVNMALFPLCPTSDYVGTYFYFLMAKALEKRLDGLKISFDDTGDIAYLKITGGNIDTEKIKKAAKDISIDTESLRFYIENGDFGYKPRGLYYALKLMYANGELKSLDLKNIFESIKNADTQKYVSSAFENNGIFGIKGGKMPQKKAYAIQDKKPLEDYRKTNEKSGIIPLIIPEKPPQKPKTKLCGDILFTPIGGGIIFLTLAFGLDIPPKLLESAGLLVRSYKTELPHFSIELCDVGKPCLLLNTGFFADSAETAASEINRIFTADDGICTLSFDKTPEKLTDLTALGGIEKNAFIIRKAYKNAAKNTAVPQALRKMIYSKGNMRAAVCCSHENFEKAVGIVKKLALFDGKAAEKTVFVPDLKTEIIRKDVNVNTISLAFRHGGSPEAAFAAAEIMKTTLLWEKVRGAGAYGSAAYATPSGSFCINSFKDINFEKTIDTFFECIGLMRNFSPTEEEMQRYRLMCLNTADRPKSRQQLNYDALSEYFGCDTDMHENLLKLTAKDVQKVFDGVEASTVKTAAVKGN
ncbi:MAG: hypothetical protein J6A07_05380 [Firmicutes bacterium]|nr:hypothetical protein [Bacillota bacterium]